MGAGPTFDAGPARATEGGVAGCGFPVCEGDAVTDRGMCEVHQRVAVSRTGSWLEAG